jgi:hypothetical protein
LGKGMLGSGGNSFSSLMFSSTQVMSRSIYCAQHVRVAGGTKKKKKKKERKKEGRRIKRKCERMKERKKNWTIRSFFHVVCTHERKMGESNPPWPPAAQSASCTWSCPANDTRICNISGEQTQNRATKKEGRDRQKSFFFICLFIS